MAEWEKVFITPQKFHDDIIKLCNMIPKDKYKYVIGVPRGGCILGVYLSHYLDLNFVDFETITYLDEEQCKFLVADDLTDTGRTFDDLAKGFDTAVLYYKPRSIIKPTYFVEEVKNTDWIVFPYEKPEEEPNREVGENKESK